MSENHPIRVSEGTTLPLRVADLPGRGSVSVRITPDATARAEIAQILGIERVKKLTFSAVLQPEGRHDWRLDGTLGATVVQSCVVTAEPVTTRIDESIVRRFLRRMPEPTGPESEIPDDDSLEPLEAEIDPGAVMIEALALALPDYPRIDGAALPSAAQEAVADERPNPFAVLATLKTPPETQ